MFSVEELSVIVELCDLALRTNGLKGVNVAVPLAQKAGNLIKEAQEAKQPEEPKAE